MKKLILFFLIFTLTQVLYTQEGWFVQYGTPTSSFSKIFMLDTLNGWVLDFDSVFNTSDGGNSWNYKNIGVGGAFVDVYFENINTGWIIGITYVTKTTNAGMNWSPPNFFGVGFNKLYFLDANTGIVAGFEKYWFSTNGGNNWTSNNLGINNITYFSIDFVNRDTGWIGGTNGVLFKTTNCGLNWVQKNTGTDTRFYGLSFTTKDTGWAGGFNSSGESKILFTSTGGESWIVKYIDPIGQGVEDIFFTSAKEGWAMGLPGKIMHTTDVGNTWEFQNSNAGNIHLFSGYFINSTTGWIVGEAGGANGKILKTTTGGIVPVLNNSNEMPTDFRLYQNYPNPFNPTTDIKFSLPKDEIVTIKVYNLLGEEVTTLVNNAYKTAGNYSVKFNGSNLASGVYFYTIEAGTYMVTKKMVLIK